MIPDALDKSIEAAKADGKVNWALCKILQLIFACQVSKSYNFSPSVRFPSLSMQHRVPLYSGPMMISKLWLKFAQSIRWSLIRFYKHSFNLHFNHQQFFTLMKPGLASRGRLLGRFSNSLKVKSPKISDKLWTLKFFSRKYKHLMKGSDKVSLHWNHLECTSFQSTF